MSAAMKPLTLTAEIALAAILGSKTETRRPLNPQPKNERVGVVNAAYCGHPDKWFVEGAVSEYTGNGESAPIWTAPFGLPGTELWLREPGRVVGLDQQEEESVHLTIEYLADKARRGFHLPERFDPQETNVWPSWVKEGHGIPNGIFREAARYKTIVREVRVERLQKITEAGAIAEGCESREDFLCTWDKIYGKRPGLRQVLSPWVTVTAWDRMVAI